jgi:alkylation response protein AidB-like acyl-CoA dehydrogenase
MANYSADLRDIEFNLFELNQIQNHKKYGLEIPDMKGILNEYEKTVRNEIFPTREISDAEGVKLENNKVVVSPCLKKAHDAIYQNGWFALGMPEEFQGTPVPEALSVASLSLATGANTAYMMYPGLSKGVLNVIRLKGNDEMKKTYIPPIMDGRWSGSMCLTEAGAGSDVGALRTTATPTGNGKFNIKGVKIFISGGECDLYQNTIHLVLARTPKGEAGTKGISLFIVPRFKINADGSCGESNNVVCTKVEHKMGIHASATCELTFGANGPCEGIMIGDEFDGMATMFIMMNEARLLCGIQGESQGNLAYMMSLKYAKERVQFGKEIINHPDVRRMLLKMRASARGMRALTLYTADLFDRAHDDEKYHGYIGLLTPICKSYCTEQGFQVASEAVQVHGGYGFCTEYGVEQFVRDTVIGRIYEGTNGIQAMDFVLRKILKDGGKVLGVISKEILADVEKLDAQFSNEKELLMKSLGLAQKVLISFQEKAKANRMEEILQDCSDFQLLASYLFVSWKLGVSAQVALEKSKTEGDKDHFYQSKIDDFKIYCQHYLVHSSALAKTMTLLDQDLKKLAL